MSNPSSVTIQLGAAAATGIATAQAVAGAGALTLNGSLTSGGVATMDVARRIIIASTGADSAVIFTVTGTNRSGAAQSETITGVATPTPVQSVNDYKTVTSIVSSGATAGNISAGTNGVGSSVWVVDNFLVFSWALAGGITGPASGTTYTLEHCYTDPNVQGPPIVPAQWSMSAGGAFPPHVYTYSGISAASGDNQFTYTTTGPIFAHRVTINSGTGAVTMDSIQAGID